MMPYRVLESTRVQILTCPENNPEQLCTEENSGFFQDYELRRYPESKWVCTQEVVDLDDDPYKDWRRRFRDGKEAERKLFRKIRIPEIFKIPDF